MFRHNKKRLKLSNFLLWRKPKSNSKWIRFIEEHIQKEKTMSNDLMLDVGQANELKLALRRNDWTNDEVKRLGEGNLLSGVKAVLNGIAKIKPVSEDATRFITINETTIAVNLGASPNLPFNGAMVEQHVGEGWVIVNKRAGGLYVNGHKVGLYLSKRQKGGKWLKGHELREELAGKPVLNANILDTLYQSPHLIPEEWKKDEDGKIHYIFFWGTIYRDSGDRLYVCYFCFDDGVWGRDYVWLDGDWFGFSPTASLAS